MVRKVSGVMYDVSVDVSSGSATYG
ncbi:MAG: hypothetical protein GY814_07040 [Gammaproteobacteria bacterium]|nr:hypothetical protein [Gammaproteobacteria bacterium]